MICRKCGFENAEGVQFCANCGVTVTEATAEKNKEYYSDYANGNGQTGGFYQNQSANRTYYSNFTQPPQTEKSPTVGEYLKWMVLYPLLNLIPGIGFIIYILFCVKYAFDDSYKARSNFFKATLLSALIGIALIAVVVCLFVFVFGAVAVTGVSVLDEVFDPSFFADGSFEHHFELFIR